MDAIPLRKTYELFLLKLVADRKISVPSPKKIDSTKIFNRALEMLPPFDVSGRGIKDTLIWLNVLRLIKDSPDEDFCFITANSKDFGQTKLHQQLIDDLGKNASRLVYFNSLEEFLSNYGDKISFIDVSLLDKYFKDKDNYLLSLIDVDHISSSTIEGIPRNCDIDAIDRVEINNLEIEDFYIFNSTEKYYKVQVELLLTLVLEISAYDRDDAYSSRSINVNGFCSCFIDISLMIDKETKEVSLDMDTSPGIGYP